MVRTLISALIFTLANLIGLLIASLLLTGFKVGFTGILFAAVLLSIIEAIAGPLIQKYSAKNVPALQGGVALVTTFVGLGITNLVLPSMHIQGITTWLAATLLVWLGALIAQIVLPKFLVKETQTAKKK